MPQRTLPASFRAFSSARRSPGHLRSAVIEQWSGLHIEVCPCESLSQRSPARSVNCPKIGRQCDPPRSDRRVVICHEYLCIGCASGLRSTPAAKRQSHPEGFAAAPKKPQETHVRPIGASLEYSKEIMYHSDVAGAGKSIGADIQLQVGPCGSADVKQYHHVRVQWGCMHLARR